MELVLVKSDSEFHSVVLTPRSAERLIKEPEPVLVAELNLR